MRRFSEQFYKKAQSVKLSIAEKSELERQLLTYIEYHPLAATSVVAGQAGQRVASPWYRYLLDYRAVGAMAVMFLMIGIPLWAERTLPGDVLYPVKVKVNEEVWSSLARTPYEKVEWEGERLERRLSEARKLADSGRLTPELEAEVSANVLAHAKSADQSLAKLRTEDEANADAATMAWNSSLEAQVAMLSLSNEIEGESDTGIEAKPLVALARTLGESLPATDVTLKATYNDLVAQLDKDFKKNETALAKLRKDPTVEADFTAIEKSLNDLQQIASTIYEQYSEIESGQQSVDDKEALLKEKRDALRKILRDSKKLNIFLTELEVRKKITIDQVFLDNLDTKAAVKTLQAEISKDLEILRKWLSEESRLTAVEKQTLTNDLDRADQAIFVEDVSLEELKKIRSALEIELKRKEELSLGATGGEATNQGAATGTKSLESPSWMLPR